MEMLTLDAFEEAAECVKRVTRETKLIYSDYFSAQTGNKVYLKAENMQVTGAYKIRGAYFKTSTLTEEERREFTLLRPSDSKKRGSSVQLRPDWEEVKAGIMEELVRAKFTQNEELGRLLLATGKSELIEGNSWNDTFWGVDLKTGEGRNELGKALMKVRAELAARQA